MLEQLDAAAWDEITPIGRIRPPGTDPAFSEIIGASARALDRGAAVRSVLPVPELAAALADGDPPPGPDAAAWRDYLLGLDPAERPSRHRRLPRSGQRCRSSCSPSPGGRHRDHRRAQIRQRRAAATRLRYIGTDCYDVADNILSAGPLPGQAEQLEQAADDLAAVARELSNTRT